MVALVVVEAATSAPCFDAWLLFRKTSYPATATLSVEPVHDTVIEVGVAPVFERLVGVDGGIVSFVATGHELVAAVMAAFDERLPAASYASIAILYDDPQERPEIVAVVVDVDATGGALLYDPGRSR
jgi:hypothetical protein